MKKPPLFKLLFPPKAAIIKGNHIEAVLTNLSKNGKSLDYAVGEYPLKWSDEE